MCLKLIFFCLQLTMFICISMDFLLLKTFDVSVLLQFTHGSVHILCVLEFNHQDNGRIHESLATTHNRIRNNVICIIQYIRLHNLYAEISKQHLNLLWLLLSLCSTATLWLCFVVQIITVNNHSGFLSQNHFYFITVGIYFHLK